MRVGFTILSVIYALFATITNAQRWPSLTLTLPLGLFLRDITTTRRTTGPRDPSSFRTSHFASAKLSKYFDFIEILAAFRPRSTLKGMFVCVQPPHQTFRSKIFRESSTQVCFSSEMFHLEYSYKGLACLFHPVSYWPSSTPIGPRPS